MNKIAICITTFLRDNTLYKTLESIAEFNVANSVILIADQGYRSEEKSITYEYFKSQINCEVYYLPFDCGLSAGRNFLVNKASEMQIPYCLISADSILFKEHYNFGDCISLLEENIENAVIGFDLNNSKCAWEYKMYLDKKGIHFVKSNDILIYNQTQFHVVDICRNIFLAKTEAIKSLWDEEFKLCEHELAFIELQKRNYKVFWTDSICFKKANASGSEEYKMYRNRFHDFQKKLKLKLGIKNWVVYDTKEREKCK